MASSLAGQQPQTEDPAGPKPEIIAEDTAEEEDYAELTTFTCRDAYVYRIPPASTNGHRAELWRVDDWDAVSFHTLSRAKRADRGYSAPMRLCVA